MSKKGIREELPQGLKWKLQVHKKRFIDIFVSRFRELLPSLIVYTNAETTSIDFLKVEVGLRNNYNIVIGENKSKKIVMLGYTINHNSMENVTNFFTDKILTKDDITFTIPNKEIPDTMQEITFNDDSKTGNFVVLKNKPLSYINDFEIIEHYVDELAEIVLSRYSISMQAKINTFFMSDVNDSTIEQLISDLYAGAPYIKVSKLFDPEENIHTFNNEFLSNNFVELKSQYQNIISEMINMLGIPSLAIEKASGVSDTEAKSNEGFKDINSNMYLDGRNHGISKLNKRFGLDIKAIYNDEVATELSKNLTLDGDDNDGKMENQNNNV